MKKKIIIIISWLLAVGAAFFIFYMSASDAKKSAEQSNKVTEVIEEIIYEDKTPPDNFENVVREIAHGVEFAVLGLFLLNALFQSGARKRFILAVAIAIIYALTDEAHQLTSPGRTFELLDISIDTIGAVVGASFCELLLFLSKKLGILK